MTRSGSETRQRLLDLVREQPGLHKSELCRQLALSWGTVSYHMRQLEADESIVLFPDGREMRAFPRGTPERHMRWIAALRQEQGTAIVDLIADSPGRGIAELSRELSTSRKIIRRHLAALDEAGVLSVHGEVRPRFRLGDGEALALARSLGGARASAAVEPGAGPPPGPGL